MSPRVARLLCTSVLLGLALPTSSRTAASPCQDPDPSTGSGAGMEPLSGAHEPSEMEAVREVVERAYLKASNPGQSDVFGYSVAISGDTVVVGARLEDSGATGIGGAQTSNDAPDSGAAYVFVREGDSWSQQAYLKASNTEANDQFGRSVAVSGDIIVVGAPDEDSAATGVNGDQSSNGALGSGAAYVFVRTGTSWSQQAYLKASNTNATDSFGESVAAWGRTVAIGAPYEGLDPMCCSGAAYVFVRDGSTWSQEALLQASPPGAGDSLGYSVALEGEVLVAGAYQESSSATGVNGDPTSNAAPASGAAYVFRRNARSWSQEAYLKASNPDAYDRFGWSIAVSGEVVVVGALFEDSGATGVNGDQSDDTVQDAGAAYLFRRVAGTWSQEAYLKAASNPTVAEAFGSSIAVAGELVVVGAPRHFLLSGGHTRAYVFEHAEAAWTVRPDLVSSNEEDGDRFGDAVAASGSVVVIAAPQEDSAASGVNGDPEDNSLPHSGAVYVFESGFLPAVAFRTAGTNPASYAADPVATGGSFSASVDNNLAAKAASLLFAFDSATSLALGGGQTLLCLDLGSGELFTGGNLAPTSSAGGVDSYSLALPNDPSLAGFAFSSQAIQFGNPPFVLSNAQDLTIGSF